MKNVFIITLLAACSIVVYAQPPKTKSAPAKQPVPAAAPAPVPAPVPAAAPAPAPDPSAILDSKEAEQAAATTEAGKYERKSVSYINALWLMDASVRGMPPEYVSYTLEKIKEKLMMKRFDYNPLPEAVTADFTAKANALTEITIDNLATLMDETLVPKILAIVDLNKELRAQNYTSEAQRNSFYATKAKEFGYTDVELAKIMNSAFIFIPVARKYTGLLTKVGTKDEQYTMKMDVGILWYRISTKGEKATAKLVVKKMTTSMGFAKTRNSLTNLPKSYIYDGKTVDGKEFAYRSCVKNAARNLLVATQEMPEFRLSGQVVEVDGGKVGFDLGKKEGLMLDDKFRIVEFEENADGSVKQTNNGWVMVTMVADSNSKEGYKSKAGIVAGDPMTGAVLSEYPRIPIDLLLKFKRFPYSNATENKTGTYIDSLDVSGGMGFQLDAQYNIGRYFGINQLFFDFGYGMGWGGAKGRTFILGVGNSEIKSVSNTCFDFSLLKKFYVGRVAFMGQVMFGIQQVAVDAGTLDFLGLSYYYELRNSGMGVGFNVGGEYALSPCMNLGVGAGYQLYGKSKDWAFYGKAGMAGSWEDLGYTMNDEVELDHSGLQFQIYLTYSPPSLPFDPIDFVRGKLGI